MEKFTGKVWVLGDDIDTDIIIPTEYLAMPTVEDMKPYGFSPLRPELAAQIKEGDIMVKIPLYQQAESLNVAVAAGILLYAIRTGREER